jgi:hypothetical protein
VEFLTSKVELLIFGDLGVLVRPLLSVGIGSTRPKPNRVALFSSLDFLFDFLDSPFRQATNSLLRRRNFEGRTIDIW